MRRPRLLLAEDHRPVREALARLLETDCDVVGSAADGLAPLDAAKEITRLLIIHAADGRLLQVQHHGRPRGRKQRRAGPVRRQARHRGRLNARRPIKPLLSVHL